MKSIFLFLSIMLSFCLYSQKKNISYEFLKDSSGYILQEIIIDVDTKTKTITQMPIPDSASYVNEIYDNLSKRFDMYSATITDDLRLNRSLINEYKYTNVYRTITKQTFDYNIYNEFPDSLLGTYTFVDTSKQIQNFSFNMVKDNGFLSAKNEDGTLYPIFLYSYKDSDTPNPYIMIEINFLNKATFPITFYFFGFITQEKIPVWVSENMKYQFFRK